MTDLVQKYNSLLMDDFIMIPVALGFAPVGAGQRMTVHGEPIASNEGSRMAEVRSGRNGAWGRETRPTRVRGWEKPNRNSKVVPKWIGGRVGGMISQHHSISLKGVSTPRRKPA